MPLTAGGRGSDPLPGQTLGRGRQALRAARGGTHAGVRLQPYSRPARVAITHLSASGPARTAYSWGRRRSGKELPATKKRSYEVAPQAAQRTQESAAGRGTDGPQNAWQHRPRRLTVYAVVAGRLLHRRQRHRALELLACLSCSPGVRSKSTEARGLGVVGAHIGGKGADRGCRLQGSSELRPPPGEQHTHKSVCTREKPLDCGSC